MNKWLLIQKDYGQLGNRLHTHANALAWCIENKVNLVNLSFKKYSQLFASDKTHTVETLITQKSKLENLLRFERIWKVLEKMIVLGFETTNCVIYESLFCLRCL